MDWKKERDLLIAQTMAFVQSVTGKPGAEQMSAKPGIGATPVPQAAPVTAVEILAAEIIAPPQAVSQISSQAGIRTPRSTVSGDLRSEMCKILEAVGMTVEVHHHEVATAGQCEIGTKFNTLVQKADELLTMFG